MGVLSSGIAALVAGALDGLGASRDQNAGRHWDTPGVGFDGPVLAWGWAPAVQIGSIGAGIAADMAGADWGRGLTAAGTGMLARALAFKLAQGSGGAKAQGAVDVGWRNPPNPVAPGTPGRSYVSNNFGFRQPPFDDDSSEVSNRLGGRISGFRQPPFVDYETGPSYDNPEGRDRFGGRVSGYRADGTNVPPGAPQSHYVSTYGGFPPG